MTRSEDQQATSPKSPLWLALAVLVGLGLAVAAGFYSSRVMMRAPTAGVTQLAAAQSGTPLNIAVEVTAIPAPGLLDARLLDSQGSEFIRTPETVQIQLQSGTEVSMGNMRDLRPGAVLQVNGVKRDPGASLLTANRVVILTGYVQVK